MQTCSFVNNNLNKHKIFVMSNQEELDMYDDKEAIDFILSHIPSDLKPKADAEKVKFVLDLEEEFYEEKGYFDEDLDEDSIEVDEDEVFEAVCNKIREANRQNEIPGDLVDAILTADYQFLEEID